jgi:hypothetical protein
MIFTVYKTTNLITLQYYIGKHACRRIMNSYLGSGKHLREGIDKYGKENFIKTTLFKFESEELAISKERDLINKYSKEEDCLNNPSGGIGFKTGNKFARSASNSVFYNKDFSGEKNNFYGKKHTEETKMMQRLNHPMLNKKRSPEASAKHKETLRLKKLSRTS